MEGRNVHATNNPFKHAGDGLMWAIRTQPNYRVHLFLSLVTLICGVVVDLSSIEWVIIVMLITIGLVIEAINTAIEHTNNAISLEWKNEIKLAKDVSAAAMLTYAFGVIIVAGIIFVPKLLELFNI